MKRVTASEARRNWFSLLDEVAAGGTVIVMRNSHEIVLRRRDPSERETRPPPDYAGIIQVPDAESADRWRWDWEGPEGEIRPAPDPG
jgi:hypothetical protein